MSSSLLTTSTHKIDRLTRDCNIFHGVMFGFSIVCVVLVSLVTGGLAATGRIEKEIAGRWVASTCAMWAIILTMYLIWLQVVFYRAPLEQRCIVRILVMVIVYSVDSFCALLWHNQAVWVSACRDSYEAFCIYTFYSLISVWLDGPDNIEKLWRQTAIEQGTVDEETGEPVKQMNHLAPFCCWKKNLDRSALRWWSFYVLQYAVINPLLALVTVILWFSKRELYEEGNVAVDNAYPYIAAIRFASVTFAFTALVYFFIATKDYIPEKKPLGKFVSIKIIVFFSFWQSVGLSALAHFGIIKATTFWSSDSIATGAANFLTCVQMWLIAVAHKYVFTHEPYAMLEPTEDEGSEDGDVNWCPRWAVIKDIFLCADAPEQLRTILGDVSHEVGTGIHKASDKIADKLSNLKEGVVQVFSPKLSSPKMGASGTEAPLMPSSESSASAEHET